jgi:hypothetical protein
LYIIPHPTSQQDTVELGLDKLVRLETGNSLLLGWIQFNTHRAIWRLIYNTRASRSLDNFMVVLRRRWLGEPSRTETTDPKIFGHDLDIKFRNLLHYALDRDEAVLSQYFAPPVAYQDKFLIFRRTGWKPGHLVVLTSGERLLWINDEYRSHCERYAGIVISVLTSLLESSSVERTPDHRDLVIRFLSKDSWRISIDEGDRDAIEFSRCLNTTLVRPQSIGDEQPQPGPTETHEHTQSQIEEPHAFRAIS